jgi:hypothetical protein
VTLYFYIEIPHSIVGTAYADAHAEEKKAKTKKPDPIKNRMPAIKACDGGTGINGRHVLVIIVIIF